MYPESHAASASSHVAVSVSAYSLATHVTCACDLMRNRTFCIRQQEVKEGHQNRLRVYTLDLA